MDERPIEIVPWEYDPRFPYNTNNTIGVGTLRDAQLDMIANHANDTALSIAELEQRYERLAYEMDVFKRVVVSSLEKIREAVKQEDLVVNGEGPLEEFLNQFISEASGCM